MTLRAAARGPQPTQGHPPALTPPSSISRWRRTLAHKWGPGYLLILPAVILLVAMMVYPLIQTVLFSFSTVQLPTFSTVFVGFQNFAEVVGDPSFVPVLERTGLWIVGTVVLQFALGFSAALIFSEEFRGTSWMRVLVVLPWTLPSVVSANLWRWMLQSDGGIINQTLSTLGLSTTNLDWLGNPITAMPAVMIAYSWTGVAFVMLLIIAGIQGVPQELYEAAKVDGANWWQLLRFITVPSIRGVLAVVVILETVSAVNSFDTLMVMTGGGPANATQILSIDIYQTSFTSLNFGDASALSVILFATAIVVILAFAVANRTRTGVQGE